MKNVTMKVEGTELVIRVDITKRLGQSGSGKSTVIASTEGNVSVPGQENVKVGLNVYTPARG